jgi:hypothetical protein
MVTIGLLALAGCRWATASPSEFAAYRATRASPTIDERVVAAARYLEAFPEGAYATEVARFLERVEPRYFAERERSREGLERYLVALPRGPHALEVRSRLTALDAQTRRPDALVEAARATEARLAAQASARKTSIKSIEAWLAAPLAPEASATLREALGCASSTPSQAPTATCTSDRSIELPLAWVPADEASISVRVTATIDAQGSIESVALEGVGLLARLASVTALAPIATTNPTDRAAAREALRRWTSSLLEARGASSCSSTDEDGALITTRCASVELVAELAAASSSPDRFVLRRRAPSEVHTAAPAEPAPL